MNDRSINVIRTQNGDVTCDPLIINTTFQDFYKSLYSAEQADAVSITSYLNNIPLPVIAEEDRSNIDAAFTPEEVWAAIQSMPNGKCPGPGGFPLEFFKKFWVEIQPIFMPAINGILKDGTQVTGGTPQGFVLFIEPLAEAIRINPDVSGVRVGDENHILSSFADDVLLYLKKPEKSIPAVLKSIATFSALSGYKINLGRSVATPFNIPQDMLIKSLFQMSRRRFKDLGIFVTPDLNDPF